jgi:AhpD family alkylhydroperoxidase
MARLPGVPRTTRDLIARASFIAMKRKWGRDMEPLQIFAYRRPVLLGVGAMESALERSHRAGARLKKIATVRVAAINGCPFCQDIGRHLSRAAGLSDTEIDALVTGALSQVDSLTALDRDVAAYAEAMTATPPAVPDGLFDRLNESLGAEALVELTTEIAWENFRSRFNRAFECAAAGFCDVATLPVETLR